MIVRRSGFGSFVFMLALSASRCSLIKTTPELEAESEITTNRTAGCKTTMGFLGVGEAIPSEGCAQLKCIVDDGVIALFEYSCGPSSDMPVPEGCFLLMDFDLGFPACCQAFIFCVEIVEKVTVVEAPLLKYPQTRKTGNRIDLRPSKFSAHNEYSKNSKWSRYQDDAFRGRTKRDLDQQEIQPMAETTESSTQLEWGCQTSEGVLKNGESVQLKDKCGLRTCNAINETAYLTVQWCDWEEFPIPQNCSRVPPTETEFPKCCQVVYMCVHQVIQFPGKKFEKSVHGIELKSKFSDGTEATAAATEREMHERERRETPSTKGSTEVQNRNGERCEFGDDFLNVGEFRFLKDCARTECRENTNGSSYLMTLGCPVSSFVIKDGCRVEERIGFEFPKCCEVALVCQEIVTKVTYVRSDSPNMKSELEENGVNIYKNDLDIEMNQLGDDPTRTLLETPTEKDELERHRRETSLSQMEEETQEGCKTGPRILKANESLPMRGCAQLKCIHEQSDYSLVIISCELFKVSPLENCTVLPVPDLKYPECCEVTFLCEMIVQIVYPVVVSAANISQLEIDETENEVIYKAERANVDLDSKVQELKLKENGFVNPVDLKVGLRSRRDATDMRMRVKNNVKPTFVLPPKTKAMSKNGVSFNPDVQSSELKNTVLTAPSKTLDAINLNDAKNVSPNKFIKKNQSKRRGKLSALLKNEKLRKTIAKLRKKEIQKLKVSENENSKLENSNSKSEESVSRRHSARGRNRHSSDPSRVDRRRLIYAIKLNKFRAAAAAANKKRDTKNTKKETLLRSLESKLSKVTSRANTGKEFENKTESKKLSAKRGNKKNERRNKSTDKIRVIEDKNENKKLAAVTKKPSFMLKDFDFKKIEIKAKHIPPPKKSDASETTIVEDSKATPTVTSPTIRRVASSRILRRLLKERNATKAKEAAARTQTTSEPTTEIEKEPKSRKEPQSTPISVSSKHDTDYPHHPEDETNLADSSDQLYLYPTSDNLDLPSNERENEDESENEISDAEEVPMKITTVHFTSSRRSYQTAESRETSRNFKQTPIYKSSEVFQTKKF